MKRLSNAIFLLLLFFLLINCSKESNPIEQEDIITGPYLGQIPPETTPKLFAPGIVSTSDNESYLIVHPNGNEIYWTVYFHSEQKTHIYCVKYENEGWSEPELLPFSGQYMDGLIAIHPDGSRLYFQSNRPIDISISNIEWNFWFLVRNGDNWSAPIPMGNIINGQYIISGPSVCMSGTLYYTIIKQGGVIQELYRSEYINGEYQTPERLSNSVNSVNQQFDSYIDPEEKYLLYGVYDRNDTYGGTDLYISFRDENDNWSETKNLGAKFNTSDHEGSATITPDGEYIFFSQRNGDNMDIFWVSSQILTDLK